MGNSYEELLTIENELLALDATEAQKKNGFGVALGGSGLHVHRWFYTPESPESWGQTATSKSNPDEDTTRFDALIASAALIGGLPGDGTPRDRFLDGLRTYLLSANKTAFIQESRYRTLDPHDLDELSQSSEMFRLPYAAANYVRSLANGCMESQKTDSEVGAKNKAAGDARLVIGENIKRFRTQCGWNQEQLANQATLNKSTVVAHEKGRTDVRAENMKVYTEVFSKALNRTVAAWEIDPRLNPN